MKTYYPDDYFRIVGYQPLENSDFITTNKNVKTYSTGQGIR